VRRRAPGGDAATYGTLGGAAPLELGDFAPPDGRPGPWKSIVGVFHAYPPLGRGDDLGTLAALVADGRLRPHIGSTRDWSELAATLDAVRRRQVRGKAVLTIPAG
ncbi:MAG: zinc-binding dehydrogenase, partial [Acidimicrobiales bacterium]